MYDSSILRRSFYNSKPIRPGLVQVTLQICRYSRLLPLLIPHSIDHTMLRPPFYQNTVSSAANAFPFNFFSSYECRLVGNCQSEQIQCLEFHCLVFASVPCLLWPFEWGWRRRWNVIWMLPQWKWLTSVPGPFLYVLPICIHLNRSRLENVFIKHFVNSKVL